MATYQILYWHDIPAQIRVRENVKRISKPLPQRFLNAIDAAAMAANLTGSDEYTTGFRWGEAIDFEVDDEDASLEDVAEAIIQLIEEEYPTIDWQRTAEALKPPEEPCHEDEVQEESQEDTPEDTPDEEQDAVEE